MARHAHHDGQSSRLDLLVPAVARHAVAIAAAADTPVEDTGREMVLSMVRSRRRYGADVGVTAALAAAELTRAVAERPELDVVAAVRGCLDGAVLGAREAGADTPQVVSAAVARLLEVVSELRPRELSAARQHASLVLAQLWQPEP